MLGIEIKLDKKQEVEYVRTNFVYCVCMQYDANIKFRIRIKRFKDVFRSSISILIILYESLTFKN